MVAEADTHEPDVQDTGEGSPPLGTELANEVRSGRLEAEAKATAIYHARIRSGEFISNKDLWTVLSLWKCTRNLCRKRVRPEGAAFVPSDTFGLVRRQDTRTWYIAQKTAAYPFVCKLLNKYLVDRLPADVAQRFHFPPSL